MFDRGAGRRIKFRLSALADQEPVSSSIETTQRAFTCYVQNLMRLLDASPTGRALLQRAIQYNTSVGLDLLLEPSSSFFYAAQNHFDFGYQPDIVQKTERGQGRYLASFISCLRRAWHVGQGCSADTCLNPAEFVTQFRCEEADTVSITHLVGWELRAAGHSFLWRYLLSGSNGDVAVVFERAVAGGPQAQFDGRALKAAFNQWFADHERTGFCDHWALEIMDMALLQQERGGKAGTQPIRREQMQRLGSLPNGCNYLAGCQLTSGWYEHVENEVNRAHLRGIERDIAQASDNKENIFR